MSCKKLYDQFKIFGVNYFFYRQLSLFESVVLCFGIFKNVYTHNYTIIINNQLFLCHHSHSLVIKYEQMTSLLANKH